jgi:dipeptidyl aminopeptidase/acylaminoacyl peptidase
MTTTPRRLQKVSRSISFFCWVALAFVVASPKPAAAAETSRGESVAQIPVEDFFRPPAFSDLRLSPDGTHVASLYRDEKDISHLVVFDLATGTRKLLRADSNLDVYSVKWLGNDRLAALLSQGKLYSAALLVVPRDKPEQAVALIRDYSTKVVGFQRARPDKLLVTVKGGRDEDGLYEFDARYGMDDRFRLRPVRLNPPKNGEVIRYRVDFDGALALAETYSDKRIHLN